MTTIVHYYYSNSTVPSPDGVAAGSADGGCVANEGPTDAHHWYWYTHRDTQRPLYREAEAVHGADRDRVDICFAQLC